VNKQKLDKHLRNVLREAQEAYRRAIAEQVRGNDEDAAWQAFGEAASALLLASWLFGARGMIDKAKIPDEAVEGMVEDGEPPMVTKFDRGVPLSTEGFGSKWMTGITSWFRQRVPISRQSWELLIEAARLSARDVTSHERQTALADMRRRSPILDSLLRGVTRNPSGGMTSVKRIVDDTFFVTAMDARQTKQVQELIAQVIEEKPTKSVVGKRIKAMNLGDFVTTAQVRTGTELTTARLETVLRTNTNRALTEGAAEVLREPKVQAFVPLAQFSATKDNRTRDTHRRFDGYVGTMDDFDRIGCSPPVGFNCRCALIPVPLARAIKEGWVRPNGTLNREAINRHNGRRVNLLQSGKIPDPGFVNA